MRKDEFWDRFTKFAGVVLFGAFVALFLIPAGCMVYKVDIVNDRYMEVTGFF